MQDLASNLLTALQTLLSLVFCRPIREESFGVTITAEDSERFIEIERNGWTELVVPESLMNRHLALQVEQQHTEDSARYQSLQAI